MKTYGIVVLAIVAIPVAWVGSALVYETWNTYTHRYRLTLEVETPEGLKSGSGVVEVSIRKKSTWIPQTPGVVPSVRGEAVIVDLGQRRPLFVLLSGPKNSSATNIARQAFADRLPKSPDPAVIYGALSKLRARTGLRSDELPTIVTFGNLADPTSVTNVQPDNLAKTFGSGTRLISATIELTGDSVTTGIEKVLPWLSRMRPDDYLDKVVPGNPNTGLYRAINLKWGVP